MGQETPDDIAESVFKHNLKASENTRRLFRSMPQEDAEDAILDEFERLMNTIEDPQRAEDAAMLVQRLAQGLESQRLLDAVVQAANKSDLLDFEEEAPQ